MVNNQCFHPSSHQGITALLLAIVAVLSLTTGTVVAATAVPEVTNTEQQAKQQQLYKKTLSAIKKNHKTNTEYGLAQLKDYPLYPYLQKAQLERKLYRLPYREVDAFLKQYEDTVVAAQLNRRWLKTLAKKKQWTQFSRYYRNTYPTDLSSNNELNCYYLEGLHQTGYGQAALQHTAQVWASGKSLPDSCDSVFKRWRNAGLQTDEAMWNRVKLALSANNTLLARYLTERTSAKLKPYARRLLSVHKRPRRIEDASNFNDGSAYSSDIVYHGLRRLTPADPQLASDLWVQYRGNGMFSDAQYQTIRNKIARQLIASGDSSTLGWLIAHDPNTEDAYLLEWRIRLALKQEQWQSASQWISLLPEDLQQKPRWRYWLARSYQELNNPAADNVFRVLAAERTYYGFLAADILGIHYGFNHSQIVAEENIPSIDQDAGIQRAREFYQLGELTPARREWFKTIAPYNQQQLLTATGLAHSWGWHQQAIHTTIKADHWNDLSIRFPLAYQTAMTESAQSTTIRLEWLYAIARQESAFAHDARSSADARGLMQIRPPTAKQVAKRMGIKFKNSDLYQAPNNIQLGSNYLKQLLDDFSGNRILATAAYNAGPHRVKKWLKRQPAELPYDIWIETLPFHETRNYVQNVLAFSVIYSHRLGLDPALIAEREMFIGNGLALTATQKN